MTGKTRAAHTVFQHLPRFFLYVFQRVFPHPVENPRFHAESSHILWKTSVEIPRGSDRPARQIPPIPPWKRFAGPRFFRRRQFLPSGAPGNPVGNLPRSRPGSPRSTKPQISRLGLSSSRASPPSPGFSKASRVHRPLWKTRRPGFCAAACRDASSGGRAPVDGCGEKAQKRGGFPSLFRKRQRKSFPPAAAEFHRRPRSGRVRARTPASRGWDSFPSRTKSAGVFPRNHNPYGFSY